MVSYFLILTLPFLGRWAGGAWSYSQIASPLTGLVLGLLCGVTDWWLLAFMLAAWMGEKPGVGHPIGHLMGKHDIPCTYELEWWEPEALRDRPYAGLALRGLINAAPYLPLMLFVGCWPILFYAVTWPLAAFIGTKLPHYTPWAWSEILRHTFIGTIIAII